MTVGRFRLVVALGLLLFLMVEIHVKFCLCLITVVKALEYKITSTCLRLGDFSQARVSFATDYIGFDTSNYCFIAWSM